MVFVISSINQKINPASVLSDKKITIGPQQAWKNETIWPYPVYNLTDHLWKFVFANPKILYTPDNEITRTFMDELDSVMADRVVLYGTQVEYLPFQNENDLLNEYAKLNNNSDVAKGLIGIVFESSDHLSTTYLVNELHDINTTRIYDKRMDYFLNNFAYKIRTASISMNGFYPEKEVSY